MSVVAIEGPTDPDIPLVLDSPHSGSDYPTDFRPAVGAETYRRAEDMDVEILFGDAPALGAPLLHALFPRIYVDVNRARNDIAADAMAGGPPFELRPGPKAALGKGVVWTAAPPEPGGEGAPPPLYDRPLAARQVEDRLARYWDPYRSRLADLLRAVRERHGRVHYIDCHSMQAVSTAMHEEGAGRPRADIVLGDREGASCDPAFTALARGALEAEGFDVAVNEPYKGADLVAAHGRPAEGVHALQIEVNRRLYMNEAALERTAEFDATRIRLHRALAAIVEGLPTL